MKTLEALSLTRLSNLEFGQYNKSILKNIDLLGSGFITDTILLNYLSQLSGKSDDYDKAMKYIAKSDETIKIVTADEDRDFIIITLERQLSVYEHTKDSNKRDAYLSLKNLFNVYKNLKNWNYEEESNGIDNLLQEMETAKYAPSIALLLMEDYKDELKTANDFFKDLFAGRTQEFSSKETFDVKAMRKETGELNTTLCQYVLSLAKGANTEEYNKTLNVINVVRKYYADRLASRPAPKKDETSEPIPPMEN